MAKSEIISTAAKPEDLQKAFASATKALSTLGLKMTTKKPNDAVIGAAMLKAKKKAEFKLSGDPYKAVKLTVECDGTVNTLGILDLAAEKDAQKRLAIMKSLVECGLASKSDLEKLEKSLTPKADPKVMANLERKIKAEELKIKEIEKDSIMFQRSDTYDKALKSPQVMTALEAAAKADHTLENLLFLKAVAARVPKQKIIDGFIKVKSKNEINIDGPLRDAIIAGTTDLSEAVSEIKQVLKDNTLARLRAAKSAEAKKLTAEAVATVKALNDERVKLGA